MIIAWLIWIFIQVLRLSGLPKSNEPKENVRINMEVEPLETHISATTSLLPKRTRITVHTYNKDICESFCLKYKWKVETEHVFFFWWRETEHVSTSPHKAIIIWKGGCTKINSYKMRWQLDIFNLSGRHELC